jgi:hypothetical protein
MILDLFNTPDNVRDVTVTTTGSGSSKKLIISWKEPLPT